MIKLLSLLAITTAFTACTTQSKHEIDMTKLKDEDRVYSGNVQVDLNGKKNADLTCDLFMNSDIAPTIRLGADGDYLIKTTKKTLAFTRISCLHTHDKKQRWIYQSLNIPRIKQPDESKSKEVYNMGTINIVWTTKDSDFEKGYDVMSEKDPMATVGKIQVTAQSAQPAATTN